VKRDGKASGGGIGKRWDAGECWLFNWILLVEHM